MLNPIISAPLAFPQAAPFPRHIGSYGGDAPGPLVLCFGGLHGNEPAGVLALQEVVQTLHRTALPFQGKFVALAGNLAALSLGSRFVERDLNRMWAAERVRALNAQTLPTGQTIEDREQKELLAQLDAALQTRQGPAIFLDLHTTSSAGAPFALISDTLTNRRYALALGTPLILGLEECVDGTILDYINELGYAAIGFEAGQHDAPESIEHCIAAIWITLVEAGGLAPADVSDLPKFRDTLRRASRTLPSVFEVRYRHAITREDAFVMQPGWANFSRVEKQQTVATDRHGAVRAPERGYLFMPLYQPQGEDGFFVVREVKPFWLRVAAWLRRSNADQYLHLLPGVHYLAGDPNSFIINTKVARWFVLEICHLLGFRKYSRMNDQLVISRRKQAQE